MWLSFALIILVATLVVIFAGEIVTAVKKYWENPWFKLLAPLLSASYLFLEFELLFTWIFNRIKVAWLKSVNLLSSLSPKTVWTTTAIEIILIVMFTMLPLVVVDRWILYRHNLKRLEKRYFTALVIWLFLVVVYVSEIQFN